MRPGLTLRRSRPLQAGAGALMLAIPASAVALAAGQADAQGALLFHLNRTKLGYNDNLVATGVAPASDAGQVLSLEYLPSGRHRPAVPRWTTIATSRVRRDGQFRLRGALRRSGLVRVVDGQAAAHAVPTGQVQTNVAQSTLTPNA